MRIDRCRDCGEMIDIASDHAPGCALRTEKEHPATCFCAECLQDLEDWGHRRMRNPDISYSITDVSPELLKLLFGQDPTK